MSCVLLNSYLPVIAIIAGIRVVSWGDCPRCDARGQGRESRGNSGGGGTLGERLPVDDWMTVVGKTR